MDRRLTKIKKYFSERFDEDCIIVDDQGKEFQNIDIPWVISIIVEDDKKLYLSFYSNLNPHTAALYTTGIYDMGISDFYISDNMYPLLDDKGEFVDMLFGEDADKEYYRSIYNGMKKDEEFALSAQTFGLKQ